MNLDLHKAFASTLERHFKIEKQFNVEWCINNFYLFFVDRPRNSIYTTEKKNVIVLEHRSNHITLSLCIHFSTDSNVHCIQLGYIDGDIMPCVFEYSKNLNFEGFIRYTPEMT